MSIELRDAKNLVDLLAPHMGATIENTRTYNDLHSAVLGYIAGQREERERVHKEYALRSVGADADARPVVKVNS